MRRRKGKRIIGVLVENKGRVMNPPVQIVDCGWTANRSPNRFDGRSGSDNYDSNKSNANISWRVTTSSHVFLV